MPTSRLLGGLDAWEGAEMVVEPASAAFLCCLRLLPLLGCARESSCGGWLRRMLPPRLLPRRPDLLSRSRRRRDLDLRQMLAVRPSWLFDFSRLPPGCFLAPWQRILAFICLTYITVRNMWGVAIIALIRQPLPQPTGRLHLGT